MEQQQQQPQCSGLFCALDIILVSSLYTQMYHIAYPQSFPRRVAQPQKESLSDSNFANMLAVLFHSIRSIYILTLYPYRCSRIVYARKPLDIFVVSALRLAAAAAAVYLLTPYSQPQRKFCSEDRYRHPLVCVPAFPERKSIFTRKRNRLIRQNGLSDYCVYRCTYSRGSHSCVGMLEQLYG